MNEQQRTAQPRTCPPWEEWRRFSHGLLAEGDSNRLSGHLDSCKRCLDLLRSLSDESDTVIGLVQSAEADYSQEPEFREVADRLASQHQAELSQWLPEVDAAERQLVHVPVNVPNPLDDYLLLEPLGRGSMGCVYKAQHRRLKKLVAVKVLAPKYGQAKDLVARFEREMQAVGTLSHPNIVAATDAGEDQGHYYLVMEYVDGLDLQTILRRLGALPIADACEIMRQACLGMEAAHQQGLVHRDVKPSNLLLAADGVVKVLDLGLVTLAAAGSAGNRRTTPVGTAAYMAPEQWMGQAVDIRADIYSAGCTLFKLLTGRVPFEHKGSTVAACRQGHCEQPPPALSELLSAAPSSLASAVEKALAKEREKRFGTPAELAQTLAPFAVGADLSAIVWRAREFALNDTQPGTRDQTLPVMRPAEAAPARRSWHRLRLAWILGVILLVGGVGVSVTWSSWRNSSPRWIPLDLERASLYWSAAAFQPQLRQARAKGRPGLRIKATDISLVGLGDAADGSYAIRSRFDPTFENPAGLFFAAKQTSTTLTFYAVQVRELEREQSGTRIHAALHHHRFDEQRPGPMGHANIMLQYGECVLSKATTDVTLEVRVSDAVVDVLVDDHLLVHALWTEPAIGYEPALTLAGHYGMLTYYGAPTFYSNFILDSEEE